MVEFAIALLLYRRDMEHMNKKNQIDFDCLENRKNSKGGIIERRNGSMKGENNLGRQARQQHEPLWIQISSNRVDVIASVLFPLAYIIFNVVYWTSLE